MLKNNMNGFFANTSIQDMAEDMGNAMDARISYYGTSEDENFLYPIEDLQFNGKAVEGNDIIEQAYNIGAISKEDKRVLRELARIVSDDFNSSLSDGPADLLDLLGQWGQKHTQNYLLSSKGDQFNGFISGICIEIGIYSCNWWHTSYLPQDNGNPQCIAPWLGYLIGRDVRGSIKSSIKYVIMNTIKGEEITVKDLGLSALSGAVNSSLGGLIKKLF